LDGGAYFVQTVRDILQYAVWLEEIDPGFLADLILAEANEDYRDRDPEECVMKLIEIFGIDGAARIVGCP
jgi:hypothetical protein